MKKKAVVILRSNEKNITEQDYKDILQYLGMEVEKDGKYYTKEAFRRHKEYVKSKLQENKISENQK